MKIQFSLRTNRVGSEETTVIEVEDDWFEFTEAEKTEYALEMFLDTALTRMGDWGWEEIDG